MSCGDHSLMSSVTSGQICICKPSVQNGPKSSLFRGHLCLCSGLCSRGRGEVALQSWVLTPRSVSSQNLTYEIILTLGQAFEVAYQLALQAQKSRPMGASAAETVETKSSKPVPKPRVGVRKSAVRGPQPPRPSPPSPGSLGGEWAPGGSSHCGRPAPRGAAISASHGRWTAVPPVAFCPLPCQTPTGPGRWPAWVAESVARREAPVTSPCVCVCFALRPRCRCPPIVAVVTVTPAPPIVLLTYRCRLLVLESRSLQLLLSVCPSARSDRELSETLVASPSLPA